MPYTTIIMIIDCHLLCRLGAGRALIDIANEIYFPVVTYRPNPRQYWSLRGEKCEQAFQNLRLFHHFLFIVTMANDLDFFSTQ